MADEEHRFVPTTCHSTASLPSHAVNNPDGNDTEKPLEKSVARKPAQEKPRVSRQDPSS